MGTPAGAQPSANSLTPAKLRAEPIDTPPGGFPLAGPSDLPDPRTHAYRGDLADVSLAGKVIASHYAEPLLRVLARDTALLAAPDENAEVVAHLSAGDRLGMLDNSRGWAWGYGGSDRLVGYVRSEAVTPH